MNWAILLPIASVLLVYSSPAGSFNTQWSIYPDYGGGAKPNPEMMPNWIAINVDKGLEVIASREYGWILNRFAPNSNPIAYGEMGENIPTALALPISEAEMKQALTSLTFAKGSRGGEGSGRKHRLWTPEEINLLYRRLPDLDVAERLGISPSTVRKKKIELGLPTRILPRVWTKNQLKLLGTMPDLALAERLHISQSKVTQKRRQAKLLPFESHRSRLGKLPPQGIALLGKVPDEELAERYEMKINTVARKRRRMGIPRLKRHANLWTTENVALLGTLRDKDLAEKLQLPLSAVSSKRVELGIPRLPTGRVWSKEQLDLLGKVSDAEIGERLGISTDRVFLKRTALGITAIPRQRWKYTRK